MIDADVQTPTKCDGGGPPLPAAPSSNPLLPCAAPPHPSDDVKELAEILAVDAGVLQRSINLLGKDVKLSAVFEDAAKYCSSQLPNVQFRTPICDVVLSKLSNVQLGTAGRRQLKSVISLRVSGNRSLHRHIATQFAPLKHANVQQLLQIAEVVNCLDVGLLIAFGHNQLTMFEKLDLPVKDQCATADVEAPTEQKSAAEVAERGDADVNATRADTAVGGHEHEGSRKRPAEGWGRVAPWMLWSLLTDSKESDSEDDSSELSSSSSADEGNFSRKESSWSKKSGAQKNGAEGSKAARKQQPSTDGKETEEADDKGDVILPEEVRVYSYRSPHDYIGPFLL